MRRLARGVASLSAVCAAAASPACRLYVTQPLFAGAPIELADRQRHYVASVMRLRMGDAVRLFNGEDGEWSARVSRIDRRAGTLSVDELLRPQPPPRAAPALAFSLLKSSRLPTVIEKATELGAAEVLPVLSAHCAARKMRREKLELTAIEAAEQCERLSVPPVRELRTLAQLLGEWDPARPILVCDERRGDRAVPLSTVAAEGGAPSRPSPALLVGPEGGFSAEEFAMLEGHEAVRLVSLGQNTLRAETAALAALAILTCR